MGRTKKHEPEYARAAHEPLDPGDAFVPDVARKGGALSADAEDFAEEYIASVTSADDVFEDARDELSDEEIGGSLTAVEDPELAAALLGPEDDDAPFHAPR
jgi:hypothetical protein